MKKQKLLIFNIFSIIYYDLIFKFLIFNELFKTNIIYMILFDIVFGIIITIIEKVFNKKINKFITIILTILLPTIHAAQFIYYNYYESIFSIYSLFHGAQVFGFITSIIKVIYNNLFGTILFYVPSILFIIFIKKCNFDTINIKYICKLILTFIILHLSTTLILNISNKSNTYSAYSLYYNTHVPILTVKNFGILTEMRLDLERTIFGFSEQIGKGKINSNRNKNSDTYNITNIDFNNLIQNEDNNTIRQMHKYFKNAVVTNKNEYTGMFEGKNLILIVAEAFSPMAIDKDLTPTLYKLYNEGFQFENFYTPLYGVSTSDGEYITSTSLLPKEGTWSMSASSKNYLPYTFGNIFKQYGYVAKAYHNNTYNFYNRHLSHTNMGYDFKACSNGLEDKIDCKIWPESDIEMINATTDEYINEEHFITYYMTVSGHLNYSFIDNEIAKKNKDLVNDLPYNNSIKAYLACQIELDKAVEALIKFLNDNGKLNDTVIAITGDHYPYGLTNSEIKSYAKYINDEKFDIHKNTFILWNNEMDNSIKVSKYASNLDILPTILNLFNIEYDSRLLIGKDILSNTEGLVILSDRSWINSYGKYDSINNTFTTFKNNVTNEYINNINSEIYNKFLMSKLVLEHNYYNIIKQKASK